MNIYRLIRQNHKLLSKKEKEIANYIYQQKDVVLNLGIVELAKQIGVSPSTVTRFCHKIGVDSFSEFKSLLLISSPDSTDLIDQVNYKEKLYHTYLDLLARINAAVDERLANRFARNVTQTNRLAIIALDEARESGQTFSKIISDLGIEIISAFDTESLALASRLIKPDDLILVISPKGDNREVNDVLKNIRKMRPKSPGIYSITCELTSPLHTITSHNTFYAPSDDTVSFNDNFSVNYIIEHLALVLKQRLNSL